MLSTKACMGVRDDDSAAVCDPCDTATYHPHSDAIRSSMQQSWVVTRWCKRRNITTYILCMDISVHLRASLAHATMAAWSIKLRSHLPCSQPATLVPTVSSTTPLHTWEVTPGNKAPKIPQNSVNGV